MQNDICYVSYKSYGISFHKIIFFSVGVTLALYLLIPLIDQIRITKSDLEFKDIQTVSLSHPDPLKKEPLEQKLKRSRELPQLIKIKHNYQLMPINVVLDMDLDVNNGDFSLHFDLKPEVDINDFVFEINNVDVEPLPLLQFPPFYPLQAKFKGIEGSVTLMFIVNAGGSVEHIEVTHSKNGEYFIDSAIQAVKKWKFKPGQKQGKAVPVRVQLPLSFDINS